MVARKCANAALAKRCGVGFLSPLFGTNILTGSSVVSIETPILNSFLSLHTADPCRTSEFRGATVCCPWQPKRHDFNGRRLGLWWMDHVVVALKWQNMSSCIADHIVKGYVYWLCSSFLRSRVYVSGT